MDSVAKFEEMEQELLNRKTSEDMTKEEFAKWASVTGRVITFNNGQEVCMFKNWLSKTSGSIDLFEDTNGHERGYSADWGVWKIHLDKPKETPATTDVWNPDVDIKHEDPVNHPSHYADHYPMEVKDMIKEILTPEEYRGYCLGNELKYRLRAGFKNPDKIEEDIQKALFYHKERTCD